MMPLIRPSATFSPLTRGEGTRDEIPRSAQRGEGRVTAAATFSPLTRGEALAMRSLAPRSGERVARSAG